MFLVTLSESFLKENVHPEVFEEFPFLLAETVPPRTLNDKDFAEFEHLYQQIHKESIAKSPYKNRIIGNLFVVVLLKIKEYFWADYNPIYEGNRSSQIIKNFKKHAGKALSRAGGRHNQYIIPGAGLCALAKFTPQLPQQRYKKQNGPLGKHLDKR